MPDLVRTDRIPEHFLPEPFLPAAPRGRALDERMHAELAASLTHLAEATAEAAAAMSCRLAAVAAAIRAGRMLRPLAFRHYYLIVDNLLAQDIPAAEAQLTELEALSARASERTVTYFGHADADQLSLELIEDGMRLAPITERQAQAFSQLLSEGFELMHETLPALHAEFSGIVHEVLLARAPQGDRTEFDGASHYQFWGLLLLNPKHHRSPLAVVEVLTHEASHSLLFGMTIDEPLVLNPDDELFPSPLRLDPRPMDGIYHATYVSARMCWAMETLAASNLLSPDDRQRAADAACTDRENYAKGLAIIDAHGRLSDTGARIMDSARDWMAGG